MSFHGGYPTFPDQVQAISGQPWSLNPISGQIPQWNGLVWAFINYLAYTPTTPSDWPATLPTTILQALDKLAARRQTVVLAGLTTGGVWYPNEFIGPGFGATSESAASGFSGSGFYQVVEPGTFSRFAWVNAYDPGSPIPADIYLAPSGNPSLLAYTGVSMTMAAGDHITTNNTDTLDVVAGDIIAILNPSLVVGYSPSAMQITAQFTPKP